MLFNKVDNVIGITNSKDNPIDKKENIMIKRFADVILSIIFILIAFPIMVVTAVCVKISSQGSIFFIQERVGKNGKPFKMIKFRSMLMNQQEDGWSTIDDPRKTNVGKIIRKLSIDELPQLFNVLKGDMSIVGPRPETPFYVNQFTKEIENYSFRLNTKPGITGLAQINGLRGDTSIEKRVQYDIFYIKNWSVKLDLQIMLITILGLKFINNEKL